MTGDFGVALMDFRFLLNIAPSLLNIVFFFTRAEESSVGTGFTFAEPATFGFVPVACAISTTGDGVTASEAGVSSVVELGEGSGKEKNEERVREERREGKKI